MPQTRRWTPDPARSPESPRGIPLSPSHRKIAIGLGRRKFIPLALQLHGGKQGGNDDDTEKHRD